MFHETDVCGPRARALVRRYPPAMHRIASYSSPLVALLAFALAACSGDDQGSATDTTTTGGTTSGTTSGTTDGGTSAASETTDAGTTTGDTTTGGTTSDPTGGAGFDALCKKTAQEMVDGETALCECQVAAGQFDSLDECLADSIAGIDVACECGVYATFPEQVAFFECAAPTLSELAACLAKADCTDDFALFECYAPLFELDCPEPGNAAELESDKVCYGKVPFMCKSGEEIPQDSACDGFPDCEDGSDEESCPVFQCKSGEEIPLSSKCDGFPDCMDESDEQDCP